MRRGSGIHIDDSELADLQIDMRKAPARVRANATATLRKASKLVAAGMRADFDGHRGTWFHRSHPHKKIAPVGRFAGYDLTSPLEAEIGIEHRDAGKLAVVLSRPVVRNPVPTVDKNAALRRSEPAILEMFGEVVEESPLGKGGGR